MQRAPARYSLLLLLLTLSIYACAEIAPAPGLEPTPADQVVEVSWDAVAIGAFQELEGFAVSPLVHVPTGATRVGALLTLDLALFADPRLDVRGWDADGVPGPWVPLELTWSENEQRVVRADLPGVAYDVELRAPVDDVDALALLTFSALVPEPALPVPTVGASRQYLRGELSAAGFRSRADWGARASRCTSADASKHVIAIHHTVTPSGGDLASRLRGIQAYHMDSRGWCDVGYHFLVTIDGQIWEGRPLALLGAHVGGQNTGNIGIAFVGCFHTSSCGSFPPNTPPDTMVDVAARAVQTLAGIHGITISGATVKGHRDFPGTSTSCPGDNLHARLGAVRSAGPVLPRFAATYVNQSFPTARDGFEVRVGEVVSGYIEMRNDGTETWRPGETFLGTTEPRDAPSPIAGPDWVAPNRAATIDRVVAPTEAGRFAFSVSAPMDEGDYPQFFSVLQEGVVWFSDPGQGGPPDDLLQIRLTAIAAPPTEADSGARPPTEADSGAEPPTIPYPPAGDGGLISTAEAGTSFGHLSGGCTTSGPGAPPLAILLGLLGLAAGVRSRRRGQ